MFRKPLAWIILFVILSAPAFLPSSTQAKKYAVRQDAQLVVRAAAMGLSGILKQSKNRPEQEKLIRQFVHAARFFPDDSGYFYVCDMDGICIAHGEQPELEGLDLLDNQDSSGLYITRVMLEKVEEGGGFFEYLWQKPGTAGEQPKLGYVMPIPGTIYFIGTGIYIPNR